MDDLRERIHVDSIESNVLNERVKRCLYGGIPYPKSINIRILFISVCGWSRRGYYVFLYEDYLNGCVEAV